MKCKKCGKFMIKVPYHEYDRGVESDGTSHWCRCGNIN